MNRCKDITGQKFGRWSVLYKCDYKKNGQTMWRCRCECGNEKDIRGSQLRNGRSQSCGCFANDRARESNFVDLTGQQFGKLTVLEFVGFGEMGERGRAVWKCQCTCGNEICVFQDRLKSGNVSSCGCKKNHLEPSNFIDISGHTFGYLNVIEYAYHSNNHTYWKCHCANCGNDTIVDGDKLRRGLIKSCGCNNIAINGSTYENEIRDYILKLIPNVKIEKSKILDGKEIDIYLPELAIGVEYCGSPFHSSENAIYCNKDKYYHQQKFLLAKKKDIHLITIYDYDYEENKYKILEILRHILLDEDKKFFIPSSDIEYTDNDYDSGDWLRKYGYIEVGQEDPEFFIYQSKFKVYRCGRTIWKKI